MRHSNPSLTANVYTDPRLLDVSGALDALPSLSLEAGPAENREKAKATGTYDRRAVALPVALTPDNPTILECTSGKTSGPDLIRAGAARFPTSSNCDKGKETLTTPVKLHSKVGVTGHH